MMEREENFMTTEKKIQDLLTWLTAQDISYEFIRHARGGTTAEASEALGVDRSKILKCLLLKGQSEEFIGVIIGGDSRVSLKKLKEITNKNFKLASPEDILTQTGYEVGGIPPFAFSISGIVGYVDSSVIQHQWTYGSAGSATTGIKFSPRSLEKVGYKTVDVSEVKNNE